MVSSPANEGRRVLAADDDGRMTDKVVLGLANPTAVAVRPRAVASDG